MKYAVQLHRKGWSTYSIGELTVYVRGQAHSGDYFFSSDNLAKEFARIAKAEGRSGLDALISRLNGTWAATVQSPELLFLAVDHVRSIQLLYKRENDVLYVFDDINVFRKDHDLTIDAESVHECLSSGYVYGDRTLFKDVRSLQPGECVYIIADQIMLKRYWQYIPNVNDEIEENENLLKSIDKCFLDAMHRLIESVGIKRIVIPLSGGYDSRLIVNYLYRLGFKNVLCYTYGVKGNGESRRSMEIAKALGYEWHYIEYSPEEVSADANNPHMDDYFKYMSNGSNRPCLQEFTALRKLKEQRIINPENDIIAPGYYFDMLAGSKIKPFITNETAEKYVFLWGCDFFVGNSYKERIESIRRLFLMYPDVPKRALFETISWQERLAKFIVNNVRSFEWLGFDWRLPVCDKALFELWLSLPYRLRERRGYFRAIFPQLAVPEIKYIPVFDNEIKESFVQMIKKSIRNIVPISLRYVLRQYWHKIQWASRVHGDVLFGDKKIDVAHFAAIAVARFPYLKSRLVDLKYVDGNAAVSLKSLCLSTNKESSKFKTDGDFKK